MSPKEFTQRRERAEAETLIIARTEEGFRVHAPGSPAKVYNVSGTPEAPTCTCLEFKAHEANPDWRCKHIQAVEDRFHVENDEEEVADTYDAEERAAIQEEGRPTRTARKARAPKPTNGVAQMLLKRSVSPDGRIDSLSVEFTTPVELLSVAEIREHAAKVLALQNGIVGGFKNGGTKKIPNGPAATPPSENGGVPAQMLDVAGMNGKWGRRLFINVQVNGDTLKLFGNRQQLAEAIEAAGYADFGEVQEGVNLNVPCRVTTKPSPDGRYTNIERVFPAPPAPQRRTR